MNLIYKDFSMLTSQTGLPPNQPTTLQVENVHNFGIFQPIRLKLVTETQYGKTRFKYVCDFKYSTDWPNWPTTQPAQK